MLQWMMDEEEKCFWLGQNLESGEALELGIPPKNIQMEEVGERVTWGPALEPVPEGLPLVPLTEVPIKESGAMPVQEDGAMADNEAME